MGRRQIRVRMIVRIHSDRCQLDRFLIIPRLAKKRRLRRNWILLCLLERDSYRFLHSKTTDFCVFASNLVIQSRGRERSVFNGVS